jgi:hypothetical protein
MSFLGQSKTCSRVIAYYKGVFNNEDNKNDSMPLEFKLRMTMDDEKRKIYYAIEHWNERQTKSSDVWFFMSSKF